MSKFEFFMAFYGLLLGLSLAELLSSFGNLLRQRTRPRWGVLTPLAGLVVFVCIVTTFADTWRSMQSVSISLSGFMAPICIGVCLFLSALMAAPRDAGEWEDLDSYFLARRRLIFMPLVGYTLITIFALELPHMLRTGALSTAYIAINALLVVLLAVPIIVWRRRVIVIALTGYVAVMTLIYFSDLTIGQQFNRLFGIAPAAQPVAAPAAD